jgi:predicted O-linked N-acetylglucosamine transferase (SPINDLY family)
VQAEEIADFIYKEKIHILIDLNGHTENQRLDIFALKPAPIQISYCGFLNTTGLNTIDYYLTDSLTYDPSKNIQYFSEKILCMTYSCMLYAELHDLSNTKPKSTDPDEIVFGSLNTTTKINTNVLNTWREILHQVPNSKIIIKDRYLQRSIEYYQNILDIDISRIIIHPWLLETNKIYYTLFEKIDISLDPFPYNGITTTCDALSCSIPVITYKNGERINHGMTASILEKCGLEELIAYSKEEYIIKAVKLAKSPLKIDKYKKIIRPRFRKSMDRVDFMQKYEDLLLSVL